MTTSIVARNYETQGPVQYDVLEANGIQGRDEAGSDSYSHLQHR